jgi:hypothetical protein
MAGTGGTDLEIKAGEICIAEFNAVIARWAMQSLRKHRLG